MWAGIGFPVYVMGFIDAAGRRGEQTHKPSAFFSSRSSKESSPLPAMASAAAAAAEWEEAERKVLVARKAAFGLPTACPTCRPVLLYLRMCNVPFDIHVDSSFPDAGELPSPESCGHVPGP